MINTQHVQLNASINGGLDSSSIIADMRAQSITDLPRPRHHITLLRVQHIICPSSFACFFLAAATSTTITLLAPWALRAKTVAHPMGPAPQMRASWEDWKPLPTTACQATERGSTRAPMSVGRCFSGYTTLSGSTTYLENAPPPPINPTNPNYIFVSIFSTIFFCSLHYIFCWTYFVTGIGFAMATGIAVTIINDRIATNRVTLFDFGDPLTHFLHNAGKLVAHH